MSTFISDLSLKNPLVLDGVRLLEFKTRFPDTPVPFFVQKSYESLCNQKLTRHVSNPVELENLPKLIPRIMNGQIFSKDTSFFSRGKKIVLKANKIAETITLASFNSIYKAKNKKHWFEKLEKELKDKEFLPLGKVPHMTDDLHSHLEKTIKNLKVEGENDHYLHIKRKLMNIRDRMVDKQGKQDYTWNSYSLFQEADIVYNGWFLILNTGEKYIMDYEYVLMLCDLSIMRYNVREITIISNKIRDEDLPDISIIDDIFKWFDDTLDIFGNESYNIFKMYESICIGVYQLKYETYSSCRELLNNILKQNEDTGYLERLKALAQIIERSKNPNQIFELFGLFRFGGHPIVNESAGCEKQKNLTRQEIEIDEDVMILSFGCFVRTFIINYVKKNKMWPDIDIDKTEENIINMSLDPDDFITYLKQNSLVFTHFDEHKDYRLWSCVHFNRLFIYNDFEDFTELLSDTSISAELESFMTAYDKNLIDPDLNFCDKKPQFKRTLMGLLMSKDFDLKEIRKVFETGNIPESWKVVALHSKERELKIEPRLFAMFCLQLRMLFAGMEKNLADGIFKYIETQTMTMSESELNDRLTSMTNPHKNQDYIPFLVATDMEKFNQRWREKALTKMEKLLDQIYGVKCYSQSMKIYKECTFYLSSRFHPPSYSEQNFKRSGIKFFQPLSKISKRYRKKCIKILKKLGKTLDTDTVWFGQDGGTEGTQQKKWTATIGIPIIYTSDQLGITIILIGQGDNQNFLLLIPKTLLEQYLNGNFSELDMKIKEIIDTFLKRLKDNLSAYGMILKLDETYVNSHLLNYGKEIIYKGCYVSSKLKRYSRTFSDINEPIPTLDSRIASIYSNSHSTSGKSFDCITSYFLAIKECVYTLSYEFLRRPTEYSDVFKFHKQIDNKDLINDDFLILVFLISKDFGGLPIMPLTDLLYRGHPDCLTSYLSWLKSISDEVPMAKKIMNWIVCSNRLSKSDSLLPLIMDPTSINWVNEYIDQSRPKTLLEDSVRSKVVNRDIKMLLNHASKEERDSIVSFLETIEPCFPRGLNEIFRQTPQGVMLQFLSMFTDMRTIKEALTKEEAIELIHMVRNKDYNRFKYLCQAYIEIQDLDIMISGNLTLNEEERTVLSQAWSCTTTLADKLREKSYGRKIIGSTMPHPSEQTALFPVEGTKCERCELTSESNSYIYYKINSDNKFDFFHTRGKCSLYNGSSTREKRTKSLINFPKIDKSFFGSQRIARIADWIAMEDGNLRRFLDMLISSRTNVDINIIKLSAGKNYGGSYIHRFEDVVLSHACRVNMRPNCTSNVYISTDLTGEYSQGKENYLIIFQGVMLYGYSVLANLVFSLDDTISIPRVYHLHITCYECCQKVEDVKLDTDSKPHKIKSLQDCKLIFSTVHDIENKLTFDSSKSLKIICPEDIKDRETKINIAQICAAIILYDILTKNITPLILTGHHTEQENYKVPLTLDDLKKLNIINILEYVGVLWYVDNLREVVEFQIQSNLPLDSTALLLIKKIPLPNFKNITDILSHPIILTPIVDKMKPWSSNFNKNGNGLYDSVCHIMVGGIVNIFKNKHVNIPIIIPHANLGIIRMVRVGLLLSILNNIDLNVSSKKLLNIIKQIDICRTKNMQSNQIDLGQWLVMCMKLVNFNSDYISFMRGMNVLISPYGPEIWIKVGKDLISLDEIQCRVNRFRLCADNFDIKQKIIQNFRKDKIQFNTEISRLSYYSERDLQQTLVSNIIESKEKQRLEHKYRLVGEDSTALWKYLDVLCNSGLIESNTNFKTSFNICEGVGGLVEMSHLFFGVRTAYFNTLLDITDMLSHRAVHYIPAAVFKYVTNGDLNLQGVEICLNTGGDITNPAVCEYYTKRASVEREPVLVTCDAETSGDFEEQVALEIVNSFNRILISSPKYSIGVIKLFYNNSIRFQKQLNLLLQYHESIKLMISNYSSTENTECFVVIKNNKTNFFIGRDSSVLVNQHVNRISGFIRKNEINMDNLKLNVRDLEKLGFANNFKHSIYLLLGDITYEAPNQTNIVSYVEIGIQTYKSFIIKRIMMIANDKLDQKHVDRIIKRSCPSDNIQLTNNGYFLLNCFLIKHLIEKKNWSDILYNENNQYRYIYHNDIFIYKIKVDINIWRKRFLRSFRHIEGHFS